MATDAEDEWAAQEAAVLQATREIGEFPHLVHVLEAVSGRTEAEVGAKVWVLIGEVRYYFKPTTDPSADIRDVYKRPFACYDALWISLGLRSDVMKMLWRDRYRHATVPPADAWLVLFWQKWDRVTEEVGKYRDSLNSLREGDAQREGMSSALFELLVCLFLNPGHIQSLKATVDQSMHAALDTISAAYGEDAQGNRRWIISELSGLDMSLMTETYMVHVDITSPRAAEDLSRYHIHRGKCLNLLQFAEAEIGTVEARVQAMGRAWQTFLGTVKDTDGNLLKKCTMCDRRIRDVVYKPCGHCMACRLCAAEWTARVNTCPICRREVTEIDSVRKHLKEGTLVHEFLCGGIQVPLTLSARVAGGDVLSLLTQLRTCCAYK